MIEDQPNSNEPRNISLISKSLINAWNEPAETCSSQSSKQRNNSRKQLKVQRKFEGQ